MHHAVADEIEFVVTTASINEGDEYEIELRLVDAAGNPLSHSEDISATLVIIPAPSFTTLLPGEYEFSSTVTIPAGEVIGRALFRSLEDGEHELDKFVTLQIKDVTFVSQNNRDMFTITVLDDDAEIGFTGAPYSVSESAGGVTITLDIAGRLTEDVTLNYEIASGTASETEDYIAPLTREVPLSAGATRATLFVEIVNDDLYENADMFSVRLVEPDGGLPFGIELVTAYTETVVTIINDDEIEIGFVEGMYTFLENQGRGTAQVRYSGSEIAPGVDVLVYYSTTVEIGDSIDINDVSGTLVLSSNNRVYNINFPITDDNAFNRDTERYTVSLGTFDMNPGLTFRLDRVSASLNVLTDDVLDFGFSVTDYEVNEASGTVELEVSVLRNRIGAGERVVVLYSTTPGSATSSDPSDFESVTGEVILSSTATVVTFAIPIVNDDTLEDSESFVVTLRKADGRDTLRLLQSEATVTILDDNDPVTIGFGSSLYSVREDQSAVLDVGVLSGGLERDITVSYDIRGGSAVAGVDYEYMTGTVTLSSDASETLSISLLEDNIFDPGETFTVVLTGHAGPSSVMLGLLEAVVRIDEDDSRPTVSLDQIADVSEGETVTVIARLSGRIDELVQLTLGPESADYKITEPTLVILAGDLTVAFELIAIDDNRFEGVEVKTVELSVSDNVVGLGDGVQSFMILDAQSRSSLALDPVVAVEEGDERIVTVRLNRALESTLTVTVSTTEAIGLTRATNAIDYRLSSDSIRIPVGALMATFTLEALPDDLYEGDEEFRLVLTPVGDLVDFGTLTRTVTILDEDLVTVGFENVEYAVVEGGLSVTVVVVADRQAVRDEIRLGYETVDGSARASDNDYIASRGEIVLSSGTIRETIEIFIPEDDAFEYDEEFTVVLGAPAGGLASFVSIELARAVARVTVENDDELTVGFEETAYRVSEGATKIELLVVVLSGSIGDGTEIEVPYSVVASTAESGSDYEVVSDMVTLGSSGTSAIEVLITDDSAFEYDETFTVVLAAPVGVMLTAAVTDVTIEDDDTVVIGFERATYVVDEDSGEVELTVAVLNGSLGDTVTLNYVTADGTAVAGADYTALSSSLTLSSDMSRATFMVSIIDDVLFETDELFRVSLSGAPVRVALNLSSAEITIENDDTVELGFESAVYSVSEGAGEVTVSVRVVSGVLGDDLTLNYATVAGTAVSGEDYDSSSGMLTLSPGATEMTFTVSIIEDALFETDEKFSVVLSGVPSGVILTVDTAEVTIEDDDLVTIGFGLSSYLILENGGQQEVVVEVKEGTLAAGVSVTVIVSTEDGTALAPGDYVTTVETEVLSSTNLQRAVNIPINLDRLIEGTEEFSVVLSLPEGDSLSDRVILDPISAPVTISDEVIVTIGFVNAPYEVSEGAGGVSVTVSILSEGVMPGAGVTLSVDYVLSDGSAIFGEDYSSISGTVSFAGETSTQEIFIPITDDNLFEGSESFTITLSVSSASIGPDAPALQLNPQETYVTIVDDDEVVIGFQETTYRVSEDTATVAVTIAVLRGTLAPGVAIDVDYSTSDDSAYAGSDYTAATGTLTFNSGSTQQTVMIALIDDKISERTMDGSDEERFTVVLTAVDPTLQNVLLVPSETEVLIADDEPGARVMVAPLTPVTEGEEIKIEVFLTTALADGVTVTLVDVGTGDAELTDYTLLEPLVQTIASGDTTAIFRISTTGNDGLYEGTETIDLEFTALDSVLTATVLIEDADDAPIVRLVSVQPPTVGEGSSVEIVVELAEALSERDVEVDFTVSGTAVEGVDYSNLGRSVTISSGQSTAVIRLTATEDTVVYTGDVSRTVVLTLTGASGDVTLGSPLEQTVTIVDNDVKLGFSETTYSVSESAGGVTITLDIAGQLTEDVTLNYEIASRTASETEDYVAPLTREVPLSAGATIATLFVEIVNDDLYENADRFSVRLVEPDGGLPFGIELVTAYTETVVTIINDDEIEIGFVEGMYTFLENQGRGTAQVRYSGSEIAPGVDVLVYYSTTVEIGDSIDINDVSGTLVLSSNNRVYNINFPITDDNAFNRDTERYTVSLGTFDMNSGLTFRLDRVSASLNVLTDDVLDFGFSVTEYEVNEGSGTVELEVSVLRNRIGAGERVVVIYSTTPGSATSDSRPDFEPVTGELILSSTSTVVTFEIPITDDDILEDSESFVVTLRKADGRDTLRLSQSEATVTILDDNDPVTVGFGSSLYSVREDQSAVLDVGVLSGGLERDITVSYDIRGGSAVAGVDYEYMTGTVTLSSDASETLSISLLEDNIFDPGETFTVVLTGHAGPSSVMLGLLEAVVRIDEDDSRPTVSLDQIVDVSEGETVTVIARLSGALSVPVELTLGPSDADYQITTPTLVILAGDLTATFELIAIDDNRFEGVEVKTVELSVSDNVVGLGDREQSFMILDAQSRSSLSLDPVAAVEEGDSQVITARLQRALESTLTITVSTSAAIAPAFGADEDDYRLLTSTVRIPAGATFATFTIEVFEDADYEGDEEFRLGLTPVGDLVDLGTLTRTVTILDNDLVTVGFENVEYAVVEGGLSVTVVVVADRQAVREEITLSYRTVDGSARVSGGDYVGSMGEIVLPAGTTSTTIEIFVKEDEAYEYDEEFTVVLSAPAAGLADFVLISGAVTSVTIENDDKVTAGFEESVYRVSESVGALELPVVVLDGSIGDDTEIEVRYSVIAGTAEAGSDYEIVNGMLTLSLSGTSAIEVLITDDSAYEYDETFTVVLDTTLVGVMLTAAVTDVTIEDDDTVEIGFERATYVVDEDSGEVELTVAVLNGSLGDTITLNYVTADGTAVAGEDYTAVSSSLTLSSDMNSATFMVTISDDVLFETDELFRVLLSGVPVRVALNLSSAEVTIVNDDMVELGFESATYSVSEDSGTVELTVEVISGVLAQGVTLSYATVDGSAVVGTDYRSEMDTLTLLAGSTSVTFTIDIIDDVSPESDETFTVVLSGASVGVSFNPTSAIVTITDDDEAPVVPELPEVVVVTATLRVSELSVSEGDTATLNIELSEAASEDVTLTLTVVGGSAVESVDYDPLLVPVVIRAGVLELTVSIRTIEDDLTEATETLVLELSVLSGPAVTGAVDRVTVSIVDDDEAPVVPELPEVVVVTATLRVSELSVSEGDTATLNIELSEAASEDVTLTLTVVGGSAVESVDYEPLLVPVVIRAGVLELTVSIRTIEDDLTEATETLVLELSVLSGPAVTGAVDRVTVTILDDDEAPVVPEMPELPEVVVVTATLRVSELSVSEGDTATLNIELSEAASEDVTLTLTVAGGSAVESVDYEPLLVPVVIRAGVLELTVSIRTIEDDVTEATETLVLELSVLDGPAVTGAVDRVTVSIVDDDEAPVVPELPEVVVVTATLRVSELSVSEGDTATLNIELSEAASEDVTLTLTVAGGSADESVDYEPLLVPVVIRAGVLELTVSIRTIDDDLTEATETLVLELSVLSGPAVTGAVDRVTVTIIDDDEAPVVPEMPELPEVVVVTATLRVSELSVSEGDTATLNIELSEAASEDVTLTLTVVGGSADESVDYEPLLVPVVIRAGVLELTVSIRTIEDELTEATETLVLELSVLSGPAVTGAVDRVTVTIIDDDEAPVVPELPEVVIVTATLRVSELSVSEGDTATLNIELSEAASEDVTLTLTVVGGSAVELVDYDPLLVPVVIRAGVLELTVSIRTID